MNTRLVRAAGAAACFAGAGFLLPPDAAVAREVAAWFVRPVALPFAWKDQQAAQKRGDTAEAFARAQQILDLLPAWTDGYAVFAYRFALDGGSLAVSYAERASAALQRLRIALAWLEAGRNHAGRREVELLQTMAFLPEVAVTQEPRLAELLPGGAVALTDAYLAQAEVIHPSPAVREQYIFLQPERAAALLAAGDRRAALLVLDTAISRSAEVRDRELATEWRTRLDEVRRWLRGDTSVDLTAVRADPRMHDLLPHLR
ncbi:MAG TPA: hypothetical protein VFZ65_05015 [Planctomycetota bacterium]|nr:hypothetical protein [Planctomycetota bacterium]